MLALKNKLKGITIYRDGCKRSGILLNDKADKKINKENFIMYLEYYNFFPRKYYFLYYHLIDIYLGFY